MQGAAEASAEILTCTIAFHGSFRGTCHRFVYEVIQTLLPFLLGRTGPMYINKKLKRNYYLTFYIAVCISEKLFL
jgi:hypothetical protein